MQNVKAAYVRTMFQEKKTAWMLHTTWMLRALVSMLCTYSNACCMLRSGCEGEVLLDCDMGKSHLQIM